jgi:hypothetical protein
MPEKADRATREFLVVGIPENAEPGTNLRLLAVASTAAAAEQAVRELGAGTLGLVAILERKALYARRPAVENVEVDTPIMT